MHSHAQTGVPAISENTLFDIASLTKVFTATAVLRCLGGGDLAEESRCGPVDLPLRENLPSVKDALRYGGGFPSAIRLSGVSPYRENPWLAAEQHRSEVLERYIELAVSRQQQDRAPVYNDTSFIALGETGLPGGRSVLDEIEDLITSLHLTRTCFEPLREHSVEEIVPTELDDWRSVRCHGIVHDENAFLLRGRAGHAGLFSSAEDLLSLAGAWATNPRLLGLEPHQRDEALRPISDSSFLIGWKSAIIGAHSGGQGLSKNAVGISGFTGTSLWIDFRREQVIAILTNRVFFGRANRKIHGFRRWVNAQLT